MYKDKIPEPPFDRLGKLSKDKYELAITRFIQLELSKRLKRDTSFYYQRENEKLAYSIYSKDIDEETIFDGNITCKTFCEIAKQILNEYGITAKIISWQNENINHTDLMIITTQSHKYIINLLSDLEYMQNGMKTPRFASKEYSKKRYSYIDTVEYINEDELSEIDKCIGYQADGVYLDDIIGQFKKENKINKEYSEKELENYIDKILVTFNKKRMMNGHIEFVRFYKILLSKLLNRQQLLHIEFFDIMKKKNNKKERALALLVNKSVKIFSLAHEKYKSLGKEKFEQIVQNNNNVMCNKIYLIDSKIDELKKIRVPKNILHHKYFKNYIINNNIKTNEIRINRDNNTVEVVKNGQQITFLTDKNGELNIITRHNKKIIHFVEEGVFDEESIIEKEIKE